MVKLVYANALVLIMKDKKIRKQSKNRHETESRILRAAETLFAERGFSGTSMDSIAVKAEISKQNLIYYFASKEVLYRNVLQNMTDLWLDKMSLIEEPGMSPIEIMTTYVEQKLALTRNYPDASKVFAHEIINGAPILKDYLISRVKPQFELDVSIVNRWVKEGLVKPVSAEHLFFTIWAATQTYADFGTQMQLLLDKPELDDKDFENARDFICQSILQPFFGD